MNKTRLAFWILTGLFCLGMLPGAVMDIAQPEPVVEIVQTLGLPLHMLTLIGVWKLLGVVALLRPQWGRLNEWAYAGFFFDLSGAAFLHGAVGDWAGIAPPLVLCALMGVGYFLRERAFAEGGGPQAG